MLAKKQVLLAIKNMPDRIEMTYLFNHILLLNKVHEGRNQIMEGKRHSTEEARKKLKKWIKLQ
jgi:hypothetical protein